MITDPDLLATHGWTLDSDPDRPTTRTWVRDNPNHPDEPTRLRQARADDHTWNTGVLIHHSIHRPRLIPADRLVNIITSTPGNEATACGLERGKLPLTDFTPGMIYKDDQQKTWRALCKLIKSYPHSALWDVEFLSGKYDGTPVPISIYNNADGFEVKPCFAVVRTGDVIIHDRVRYTVLTAERDYTYTDGYVVLTAERKGRNGKTTIVEDARHPADSIRVVRWAGDDE